MKNHHFRKCLSVLLSAFVMISLLIPAAADADPVRRRRPVDGFLAVIRRHRAEEKALYGSMIPIVRSTAETRAAIASKSTALIKTLTAPERRIMRTVYLNVGEHGKTAFDNFSKALPFVRRPAASGKNGEEAEEQHADPETEA